jgi:hypothetical protein
MATRKKNQPTVSHSFEIDQAAQRLFEDWFHAPEWLVRPQKPDIHIDYRVEAVAKREPVGLHFQAQIKGRSMYRRKTKKLLEPLKTKHLRYYLQCQEPVFVFLIDPVTKEGHWLFAQRYLKEEVDAEELHTKKTLTLQFASECSVADITFFEKHLSEAWAYLKELHPGSIQAALEKGRRDLQAKEPRLSYEITVSKGVQTVHLSAKEPFEITVLTRKDKSGEIHEAVTKVMEHGGKITLAMGDIEFSGSPLFEEFNDQANAKLLLQFGEEIPGSLVLRIPRATDSLSLSITGSFFAGSRAATFHGSFPDAPLSLECAIALPATKHTPIKCKIAHPTERWHGQPVRNLAYFDQIARIFEHLHTRQEIRSELFFKGNSLVEGRISMENINSISGLVQIINWLRRCRKVAECYAINPGLPDLTKITSENWEAVNDLFILSNEAKVVKSEPGLSAKLTVSGTDAGWNELPMSGCFRLDNPDPTIHILGVPVRPGPLRTFFTNVTMTRVSALPDGRRIIAVKGTDSTLNILERF